MAHWRSRTWLLVALSQHIAGSPAADAVDGREREHVRRLQERVQQLQEESVQTAKTTEIQLQAMREKAAQSDRTAETSRRETMRLREQLKRLTADAREGSEARHAEGRRVEQLQASVRQLEAQLAAATAKWQEASQQQEGLSASFRTCDTALARRSEELRACVARNQALFDVGVEVLGRYNRQGFFDRALKAEPLLQLRRVEVEKEVQDFRDRLEDARPPSSPVKP